MRDAADAAKQALAKVITDISLDRGLYDVLVGLDLPDADAATRHYLDPDAARLPPGRRRPGRRDPGPGPGAAGRAGRDRPGLRPQHPHRHPYRAAGPRRPWPACPRTTCGPTRRARTAWSRVTTDYPDVIPFLTYATDADARETLWRLFRQRGHPANVDVLARMIERRHELATLLGYPSWAAVRGRGQDDRHAPSNIADFIDRIAAAAADRCGRDYDRLLARKRVDDPAAPAVNPWDSSYLDDRLKAEELAFDTQAMRPYFEYGRVKAGLMGLVERLFGVRFRANPDVPVLAPRRRVPRRASRRRAPARPDLPRHAPAAGQVQPRRDVHHDHRQGRAAPARVRPGLQPAPPRRRAGPAAALRCGDVLPRVRPPDPPHLRRAAPVVRHQRHRHRVGLRRGAVPAARGVGPRRADAGHVRGAPRDRRAAAGRDGGASCARPRSSARACSCGSRCSTPR